MKINIYYDVNGVSILDVLTEDFMDFLKEYLNKYSS